jgi:hypothetical protein
MMKFKKWLKTKSRKERKEMISQRQKMKPKPKMPR